MLNEKKNCPFCGEEILSSAIKCKHCHSMLNEDVKNVSPGSALFTTNKLYLGSGVLLPAASGTLTMYHDYMEFIPSGLRLARGKEVFLKYSDIVSMKFPIRTQAIAEIQTRYGEKFTFQTVLWNKSEINQIADILRKNVHAR